MDKQQYDRDRQDFENLITGIKNIIYIVVAFLGLPWAIWLVLKYWQFVINTF